MVSASVPFRARAGHDVLPSVATVVPRQRSLTRTGKPGRAHEHDGWWCALAGVGAGVALTALSHRGFGDDTYITLDYARTLVEHGQWALVPGHPANTATSPMNVVLLAAVLGVTGSPTAAVGTVLVTSLVLSAVWCRQLGRLVGLGIAFPLCALALLATSPLLVSTIGLETYLGVAVVVGAARFARQGRPVATGALCGLAVLVRPDVAVPAVVAAGILLAAALRGTGLVVWARAVAATGLAAAVVALPWHLYAWVALGGFLPDTFAFKTGNPDGVVPAMIQEYDALFWSRTPTATAITTVLVVAGWACAVLALARHRRSPRTPVVVGFATAGTAHAVALMVLNSYPQAWYYGPLVAGSALAVAAAVSPGARTAAWSSALLAAAAAGYCTVALAAAGQGGLPWTAAEMNSNFTTAGHYARIGRDLPALVGDDAVAPPGEIGAIAWFCRCPALDHFSDRALARPVVDTRYGRSGTLTRAVLDVNWWFRPEPPTPALPYRLRYVRGTEQPPPGVVHTWWVQSPQTGAAFRIVLVRG